ncbi:MAG: metallophosphoesterase family protein [Armatimonadetes bacterium]|nr:metallophosphoesterase family protein [Armatimonadota bacterium]
MATDLSRRGLLRALAAGPLLLSPLRSFGRQASQGSAGASRYAPTRHPDRIVLNVSDDPTTQPVCWRTSAEVDSAFLEVMEATRGPIDAKKARRIAAQTTPLETMLGPSDRHRAVIDGLQPGASYVFRVGDGERWSEWCSFRAFPGGREPFRFLYLGDSQNDILGQVTRVARAAMLACPDAAFAAHGGDLVERGDRDDLWGEWFESYTPLSRTVPFAATPGNHDYAIPDPNNRDRRILPDLWKRQFSFPANGPEGLRESVYWFDRGDMRFVSLNTMEKLEPQLEWLERVVPTNRKRWMVVMFHHPVYSSGNERDSDARRKLLEPAFTRLDVDLVLQGHDHTYARTGLVANDQPSADRGTVYLTSVTGPKMYRLTPARWHRSLAAQTQLYQVVTVSPDELRVEARTVTGELHDSFRILKDSNGRKRLVEDFEPRMYNPAATESAQ